MARTEERTESVFIYVTPEVKKELEAIKDNESLKIDIIKRFLRSEEPWLEEELRCIEEMTIKYKAKMIGIKDAFSTAQDAYVTEIEQLYRKLADAEKSLDSKARQIKEKFDPMLTQVRSIHEALEKLPLYRLEKAIELIDSYNRMDESTKEMFKLIVNNQK